MTEDGEQTQQLHQLEGKDTPANKVLGKLFLSLFFSTGLRGEGKSTESL